MVNLQWDQFVIGRYDIIAMYIPIFLIALVANFLVIIIVIKYNYMRK